MVVRGRSRGAEGRSDPRPLARRFVARTRFAYLALLATLLTTGCGPDPSDITVAAAASLADVLEEAAEVWEAEAPGEGRQVTFQLAGSNLLARQIAAGAPVDLFVAADQAQLAAAERGVMEQAVPLLGNSLVVVVPADSEIDGASFLPEHLLEIDRLVLADPEAAPAGAYARRWLEAEGLWERLQGRVIPTADVRAALAAVASGSADAGIVYATDAAIPGSPSTDRVRVVLEARPPRAPRVLYFAAPIEGGADEAGEGFLRFLEGETAGEIFRRHGFTHLPAGPRPRDAVRAGSGEG